MKKSKATYKHIHASYNKIDNKLSAVSRLIEKQLDKNNGGLYEWSEELTDCLEFAREAIEAADKLIYRHYYSFIKD